MKHIRILTGVCVVFAILLLTETGAACSCVSFASGNPPCQSFWNTPVVFSGRVAAITPVEKKVGDSGVFRQLQIRFAVSARHRGDVSGFVDVTTGQGGGDCGYRFEVNEHYLVYAHKGENGALSTGICSATKKLVDAKDDLDFVESLAGAKPVGTLFGGVWEYKARRSTDEWQPNPTMPGISLTLTGNAGRYSAVTDKDGKYRIADIKPGEYLLTAEVPRGYTSLDEIKVKIPEKGCSVSDLTLTRETSVSGRIIDSEGRPVTKLLVDMVLIEEIDFPHQKDRQTAQLDDTGRFKFRHIPPGSYYLGIGLGRWSVVKHSFPMTFYPGTPERGSAAVVVVEEGATVDNFDFQLPRKLAERMVTGTVVFPDGKPAAKARLIVVEGAHNNVDGAEASEDGRFELALLEGLSYRVRAYVNLPSGVQRHAEFVAVPSKGKVNNLRITITEANGNCSKCLLK